MLRRRQSAWLPVSAGSVRSVRIGQAHAIRHFNGKGLAGFIEKPYISRETAV
jgi:hypothetical protein